LLLSRLNDCRECGCNDELDGNETCQPKQNEKETRQKNLTIRKTRLMFIRYFIPELL